jgi:hypothetical protein
MLVVMQHAVGETCHVTDLRYGRFPGRRSPTEISLFELAAGRDFDVGRTFQHAAKAVAMRGQS